MARRCLVFFLEDHGRDRSQITMGMPTKSGRFENLTKYLTMATATLNSQFDPADLSQHPEGTLTEVPRVATLTDDEFVQTYLKACQPVIITDMATQWPAMQKWTFDFFRELNSEFKVSLEVGNVMQEQSDYREVTFKQYLDEIEHPSADVDKMGYLSVFNVFNHFPELRDDVDFSLMSKHKLRNHAAGWIGPSGTVTGYHIDWADNLLVQIKGEKFIKLVSPDQRQLMYPSAKYDSNTLMSSVNTDQFDAERFPRFKEVRGMYTVLKPGEMLFNPRGWWHYVRALSPSISVNSFGIDWKGFIRDKPREYTRKYLHRMGLFGKECTCHKYVNGKRVPR